MNIPATIALALLATMRTATAHDAAHPGPPAGMEPETARIIGHRMRAEAPFCEAFAPDAARVLAWLGTTWPIPPAWVTNALYSPCAVDVIVTMADGRVARLTLQSSGAGSLVPDDGASQALFGPLFWADPFGGPYFNAD